MPIMSWRVRSRPAAAAAMARYRAGARAPAAACQVPSGSGVASPRAVSAAVSASGWGGSRRNRRDPPHPDALTAALTALGLATPAPDGTWHAAAGARAPARYRAIAAAAAGRDLTR